MVKECVVKPYLTPPHTQHAFYWFVAKGWYFSFSKDITPFFCSDLEVMNDGIIDSQAHVVTCFHLFLCLAFIDTRMVSFSSSVHSYCHLPCFQAWMKLSNCWPTVHKLGLLGCHIHMRWGYFRGLAQNFQSVIVRNNPKSRWLGAIRVGVF